MAETAPVVLLTTAPGARPRVGRALTAVAAVQGVYFLLTGVWPLVHVESFLAVRRTRS
jgi:hypothetical protein